MKKEGKYIAITVVEGIGIPMYIISSIEIPKSLEEAWEKSLEKWEALQFQELYEKGKRIIINHGETCGLCNIFKDEYCYSNVLKEYCPVYRYTQGCNCNKNIPYVEWTKNRSAENAKKEYDLLLSIKAKEEEL